MLPAAVALMWWLRRLIRSSIPNDRGFQLGAGAGAFALVVHLLGAGGIGMPAVTLMVLGLAALAASNKETSVPVPRRIPAYFSMGLSLVALGLIVLLCVSSLLPTRSLQAKMLAGDNLVRKGLLEAADAEYSAAARADDWSPDPWRRRAELAFRQVEADHFRSNDSFQKTVNHLREAVKRDPLGFADVRRLGECWISRWRTSRQLSDAEEAVQAFEIAWSKYPTNALIMSELAFANEAAGAMEVSTRIASQALKQDQVNRKWGHLDRYLPEPTRERLEALTIGK